MKPQCSACDTVNSLEHLAHGWHVCSSCAAQVLLDAQGRVVRVIHARKRSSGGDVDEPRGCGKGTGQ